MLALKLANRRTITSCSGVCARRYEYSLCESSSCSVLMGPSEAVLHMHNIRFLGILEYTFREGNTCMPRNRTFAMIPLNIFSDQKSQASFHCIVAADALDQMHQTHN